MSLEKTQELADAIHDTQVDLHIAYVEWRDNRESSQDDYLLRKM